MEHAYIIEFENYTAEIPNDIYTTVWTTEEALPTGIVLRKFLEIQDIEPTSPIEQEDAATNYTYMGRRYEIRIWKADNVANSANVITYAQ